MFGLLIGAVYLGHYHLAFRSKDRVRLLAGHFDGLIREAPVDACEVSGRPKPE